MARAGDNYEPTAPKPYEFVSIPQVRGQDREHPAGHDRYDAERLSGHLSANLLVLTWLHVGAGSIRLNRSPKYPLIRSHVRVGGQVAMPASSLKGMVRSVAEAISHSCVRVTRAPRNQLPPGAAECRDKEKLCPACRLFGALGYQGLVRFSDAVLRPEEGLGPKLVRMPSLYAPRGRSSRYVQSGRVAGRKFYQHGQSVINADTPV